VRSSFSSFLYCCPRWLLFDGCMILGITALHDDDYMGFVYLQAMRLSRMMLALPGCGHIRFQFFGPIRSQPRQPAVSARGRGDVEGCVG